MFINTNCFIFVMLNTFINKKAPTMKKASILKLFIALIVIWLFRLPLPSQIHFNTSEDVGMKLKEMRKSYHLSLDELSRFTGLNKEYLQGVESGKYAIGDHETKIISDYFGQDLSSL